jgi:uncharacterized protein YkwD
MQQDAVTRGERMSMRAAGFILLSLSGCLLVGGCADTVEPVTEPSFYASMAKPGAKVDAAMAASMISGYRQNNGLSAVTIDPQLMNAAENQSATMVRRDKMDHNVGGPLPQRLRAVNYDARHAVENISAGYHTLAEAFSGWRDSPPHRANMLAGDVTRMGIAASYAPNSKYKVFWTLILAAPDKS